MERAKGAAGKSWARSGRLQPSEKPPQRSRKLCHAGGKSDINPPRPQVAARGRPVSSGGPAPPWRRGCSGTAPRPPARPPSPCNCKESAAPFLAPNGTAAAPDLFCPAGASLSVRTLQDGLQAPRMLSTRETRTVAAGQQGGPGRAPGSSLYRRPRRRARPNTVHPVHQQRGRPAERPGVLQRQSARLLPPPARLREGLHQLILPRGSRQGRWAEASQQ